MKSFTSIKIFALLFILSACDSQKSVSVSSNSAASQPKTVENNIVYLFFEIERQPNGNEKITHTDTKTTKGILKNNSIENEPRVPGKILITMLRNNGETVEERIIEDPLNPILESYSEEGLDKKQMNLQKAEFSLRFNQKGDVSSIKMEKILTNSKNHLITIKL